MTNPNSVTVAYTSSDSEKATIDASTGAITLVAAGNTTISAVFEGNDTYEAQTVTYTLTVNAAPEPPAPTTYSITVGGSENQHVVLNENSAESGASIIVSAEAGWTYNTSADSDQIMVLTFSGVEATYDDQNDQYTFTMPSNDVSIEAERYEAGGDSDDLPEEGTVFDFVGYADDSTSTPSSTGQITYEGEYSENTDYVYGTANVLFAGAGSPVETTVYMTKTDLIDALDGARVMVYALDNSSLVGFGYGELSQLPTFETLNITQYQNSDLSASVQTDTDWTGKTVYVQDQNMNIYLKMIPDGTDPTLLVLDTVYDGNVATDSYLDSNPTGSVTVSNLVENRTYTCDYSWTNEVVVP